MLGAANLFASRGQGDLRRRIEALEAKVSARTVAILAGLAARP
jgi:hypothetical protein